MRRWARQVLVWNAVSALVAVPGLASAQDSGTVIQGRLILQIPDPEPLGPAIDQERLGEWLGYIAETERRARRWGGANQLVVSSLVMGLGTWAFVTNPTTELDKGLGLAAVFLSGITLSIGIFQLAKKTDAETRFARWQAAMGPQMTERELARFEGELRSQSHAASRSLRFNRWFNFGLAMTGGLVLGLTPVADLSRDGRTTAYAIGGVAAGLGFLGFGVSFAASSNSDYWAAYQRGQRPSVPGRKWGAAPAVGRRFVGAQLVGRF